MVNTQLSLSPKHTKAIVWVLMFIMPIIGMAVDLVTPSLPAISHGLDISAGLTKSVVSLYLFGYAFGNLFTGSLTDAYGRRLILRVMLFGFVLMSLLPVFFPTIHVLLAARFLQGITLGASSVILRSIFSDILPPEKLVPLGAVLATMWGLGPIIGPFIGGYLQFYFGWQSGFVFFAIVAGLMWLLVMLVIPETHYHRQPLNLVTIKRSFKEVLSHKLFMSMILLMGLVYSLIISFNTLGPFFIQVQLQHTSIYFGHFALSMGIVFLLSTFLCKFLLKHMEAKKLFLISINFFFAIMLTGLFVSFILPYSIPLTAIISGAAFVACGLIFPTAMGVGMSLFRHIAGTATAIMFFFNIFITSLSAFIASFIHIDSTTMLFTIYVALMFFCFIIYWGLIHCSNCKES